MTARCLRRRDAHNFGVWDLMGTGPVLYCSDCGEIRRLELTN